MAAEQRILDLLRSSPSLTRGEIAARTGLPDTTVVSAVTRLLGRDVLVELERHEPRRGRGRPARALALAQPSGDAVAIAMTRGEMRAALVALNGTVRAVAARPYDPNQALDGFAGDALELLQSALDRAGHSRRPAIVGAAVGVPAPLHPGRARTRRVITPVLKWNPGRRPLPDWLSEDPTTEISHALGVPCLAENDANLAALGEAAYGAGRAFSSIVHVKFIHGIGAGVVIDGRLIRGAHGFAGEIAHLHVDDAGPICVCGRRGCLSPAAGPHRLVELAKPTYGDDITLEALIDLAATGDEGGHLLFEDLGHALGAALGPICVLLNPQAIILDARLDGAAAAVIAGIRARLTRDVPAPIARTTHIQAGELGAHAELLGGAALIASRDGELPIRPVLKM